MQGLRYERGSGGSAMQASMSNEKAEARSRIRSRAAALLAAAAAGLLVVQFFFPFVTFRPDGTAYTFTSLQMVTGFLRFQETAVAVPWTGQARRFAAAPAGGCGAHPALPTADRRLRRMFHSGGSRRDRDDDGVQRHVLRLHAGGGQRDEHGLPLASGSGAPVRDRRGGGRPGHQGRRTG